MKNNYKVINGVAHVSVTSKGESYIMLMDEEDVDLIGNYTIGIKTKGYAGVISQGKSSFLHRVIVQAKDGLVVDHLNGDRLDNRKCNLREVSCKVNNRNVNNKYSSDLPRGVSYYKRTKQYMASIKIDGYHKYLGYRDTIEEAEKLAIEARRKYWGDDYNG